MPSTLVPRGCFSGKPCSCLLQVGSVNNTFGIKGVKDHAWFLKSVDDAHKLRVHLR